jgi:L-alanine-DL-glutamate epimerase-like enolase superfamily enzyme
LGPWRQGAGLPLWRYLGGATSEVEAYNTDVGWLSIPDDALVAGCRRAVEEEGFRFLKLKVGRADPRDDVLRLRAVRAALGDGVRLAVDGNGRWDLPTCLRFSALAQDLALVWFEEPLWYDDVPSHAALARASTISRRAGEQLYTKGGLRRLRHRGRRPLGPAGRHAPGRRHGVHRGGPHGPRPPSPRRPPRGRDEPGPPPPRPLAPAVSVLEYIPWIRDHFEDGIRVEGGRYLAPRHPGAGTTPRADSLARFAVDC